MASSLRVVPCWGIQLRLPAHMFESKAAVSKVLDWVKVEFDGFAQSTIDNRIKETIKQIGAQILDEQLEE